MWRRLRLLIDLVLAVGCVVLAVPAWYLGAHTTWFFADGELPGFESAHYSGPWLLLAAGLVVVAGLAIIDLVAKAATRSR